MSKFVVTEQHLREVLLFYFKWKKSAAEAHRMLMEVYGDNAPTEKSCRKWFRRFKNGRWTHHQYSDSSSSELEEVERKDAAETMVQLSVHTEGDILTGETSFDTSEVLIKREVPDELPQLTYDLVDSYQHVTDYTIPTVVKVKEEPIEPNSHMIKLVMVEEVPLDFQPPQFKEEPLENWQ